MLHETADDFLNVAGNSGVLMCLDVGEKTLGVALSDGTRTIASPLTTIHRKKFSKDIEALAALLQEYQPVGIILGMPINMDGSKGRKWQSVKQFAYNLAKESPLPLFMWDERMSTMGVEHVMKDAELSRKRKAEVVDKLAASFILQGFLENRKQSI
jgi:putative Holliday junction resolvase